MPWTPNLAIGVDIIDNQHKMLFEKAEKLFEAGRNKNSKEYISELLDFLDDYTKKHFADEEKYMLSINYPGYAEQKQAHTAFIGKIAKLREEYNKSGGSLVVIINANKMVLDWITQHISVMDKKIGDYAKSRKI
ncbi:MAG TPA: hemerythrin family protein [Clostridiales bacterium]|nr:hemerythrin family protein [Clostridiales bacterium]